ncbi:MAG: tyrosine--tRNA ligase [Flavobacteriales bacterium]|nr:tyrosine--tRNA ligase [Flavobacteriales bacterium]MDW8431237.1 tyrosine--tRNA ligase [Flavobacteriales bacterium]
MTVFDDLRRRGIVQDFTAGTAELLSSGRPVRFYAGFDPTADSLHLGHLVPVMAMARLQKAGHIPFVVLGGATGMVGDPSGKNQERPLLDLEAIQHNLESQKQQLRRFLDFDGAAAAQMVNNADWFSGMGYLEFLRNVGKHLNVAYMISKDLVKRRLETGLSYAEFSYQLIQAYDFLYLRQHYEVQLQLGGSDQWGNITAGIELIRRILGTEAYGFTVPLLTKADGTKFGKSEGGNVWLDSRRTSPYKFYQYLINIADEDVKKLLLIFSPQSPDEIEDLLNRHLQAPHQRLAQHHLADHLTRLVHGEEALQKAQFSSAILFGKASPDQLKSLTPEELEEVFETVPQGRATLQQFLEASTLTDLLALFPQFFPSKSEIRRLMESGGMYVNRCPINSNAPLDSEWLLHGRYLLVQKGKKQFFLLQFL